MTRKMEDRMTEVDRRRTMREEKDQRRIGEVEEDGSHRSRIALEFLCRDWCKVWDCSTCYCLRTPCALLVAQGRFGGSQLAVRSLLRSTAAFVLFFRRAAPPGEHGFTWKRRAALAFSSLFASLASA